MGAKNRIYIGIAATVILSLLGIVMEFGEYLRFPAGSVIEPYGDGFKAYMSTAYHAMYDSSYTHFQGMNYPYGDHLVFSDPQPLLANTLKLLKAGDPGLLQTSINWTHLLMLISIAGCALLLFGIFIRLKVPVWYAVTAATLLSFLSPMIARIGFHYGLAQPAAIPAVLLLLLYHQERPRYLLSMGIGVTVLLFSLLHFQYFGILVLGISAYFLADFLMAPKKGRLLHLLPHYALQTLLPFFLLTGWLSMGAQPQDRATQPFGFLYYRARLEGSFTSMDQPHWKWFMEQIGHRSTLDVEAINYIGLAGIAGLLAFTVGMLRRLRFAAEKADSVEDYLQRLYWSGLLLFVFSLGFPFNLPGMEKFVEYLGPLRQFRALGRFSWFFFFTSNVIAVTYLFKRMPGNRWLALGTLFIIGIEAFCFTRAKDLQLNTVEGLNPDNALLTRTGVDPGDFQAILPIPYFHIGSDNFWVEPEGFIQQSAMVLSLQSGLPLCAVMMSRTSVGQTFRQLQLVGEPYRKPIILEDYSNNKPLLMLVDAERFRTEAPLWDHFGRAETGIRFLKDLGRLKVYAVPLSFFEANAIRQKEIAAAELSELPLFQKQELLLSDSLAKPVVQSWDEKISPFRYQGPGGFVAPIRQTNSVYEGTLPDQEQGKRYLFSIWMYLNADMRGTTTVAIRETDPESGTDNLLTEAMVSEHARVFDSNGWALVEIPFQVSSDKSRIRITFNNTKARGSLFLDEMLIRPENARVYVKKNGAIVKNNRWYNK